MSATYPPKPPSRKDEAGAIARLLAFRRDMFRSQPERLYSARVARMRTPLFDSFLVNEPGLIDKVLEFPKARVISDTLRPMLGRSVFLTNGAEWEAQRRIIDPAFEGGRLRDAFPSVLAAGRDATARLSPGETEMEFEASYLAADVIFRALFSVSISHDRAKKVFDAFRAYQRAQPLLSARRLLRLPGWLGGGSRGARHASMIRRELKALVDERAAAIADGSAPDDLATKLMTGRDPQTDRGFDAQEMLDQVAIFFLAGHETSASALAWALYCLAQNEKAQEEVRAEADGWDESFAGLSGLGFTRDVFREALRLYAPVPVMVREADGPCAFRGMPAKTGDICMVAPFYVQRSAREWSDPHAFDPWRWGRGERGAHIPFSKGRRVCPGAGFAMVEGMALIAMLVRAFRFETTPRQPVPVAHLTVRSEDGIFLRISRR